MDSVYFTSSGTVAVPRGPYEKTEALKVAAAIIRLLEETDFDEVKKLINNLEKEDEQKNDYLENVELLKKRGYEFHHSPTGEDSFVKMIDVGIVIVMRNELRVPKEKFTVELNRKEKEAGAIPV